MSLTDGPAQGYLSRMPLVKTVRAVICLVVGAFIFTAGSPALAQMSDETRALQNAIDALRESQQRIEKELAEIKTLLRGRQAGAPAPDDDPQNVVLTVKGAVS